jgi:hypothetical protein
LNNVFTPASFSWEPCIEGKMVYDNDVGIS